MTRVKGLRSALAGALGASLLLATIGVATVAAAPPDKEEFFVCPSVSTHDAHGMWVVGQHGAYYVNIPTKGGVNAGSRVYLTVPVSVPSRAQVQAGWGLYKDYPGYPNFGGMAVVLSEGIDQWLGGSGAFHEGDVVMVVIDGSTTTVTVVDSMMTPGDIGNTIRIEGTIPMASAAIW